MDVLRRRMSLKEFSIPSKGYASSPTMTRNKSTPSNNKKYLSFRARSGSINPAAFLKGNYSLKVVQIASILDHNFYHFFKRYKISYQSFSFV